MVKHHRDHKASVSPIAYVLLAGGKSMAIADQEEGLICYDSHSASPDEPEKSTSVVFESAEQLLKAKTRALARRIGSECLGMTCWRVLYRVSELG